MALEVLTGLDRPCKGSSEYRKQKGKANRLPSTINLTQNKASQWNEGFLVRLTHEIPQTIHHDPQKGQQIANKGN